MAKKSIKSSDLESSVAVRLKLFMDDLAELSYQHGVLLGVSNDVTRITVMRRAANDEYCGPSEICLTVDDLTWILANDSLQYSSFLTAGIIGKFDVRN